MKKDFSTKESIVLQLEVAEDSFSFSTNLASALSKAELELLEIEGQQVENEESLKKVTANCDKTDYILAASSGALCGIFDIFLVGKPGESKLGKMTDTWVEERVKNFAKLCGGGKECDGSVSEAKKFLERKFKIPYDQTGAGDAGSEIFRLNTKNHHFKSLGHNPTLLGLFFSILDQFCNTSHFVANGELISLKDAKSGWELQGNTVPAKLFCGFVNWFGHMISDMSGSSGGNGRGMGIPSPFMCWTNDIIALKETREIPTTDFDRALNDMAEKIYVEGYDARFQATQAIPVFVNEMIVRTLYSVRRMFCYFGDKGIEKFSFKDMWNSCEPFKNATVKRMLTVAHGTFCLIDMGDATIRGFICGGGAFNPQEFVMRLNLVGVGRFTISLYSEAINVKKRGNVEYEAYLLERKKSVLEDYIQGLKEMAAVYDDQMLLTFIDDLKTSKAYKSAFEKSVNLAEKRCVPISKRLIDKRDIDAYFNGEGI
ncbi:hypothetical protein [Eubacterium oxidoreducens]|uniref:Uncharacterized protein n=1 Tax=Eubacterium oxidoreducens TaxID=1732 RepID=A0A1G6AVL5_EUBOX|nr:hypothetical protein [Eubacterium oxidoreducens]SDB12431.1 hypothetical protein SAMN02910417_00942 [Eubacterium oxidoreducens]